MKNAIATTKCRHCGATIHLLPLLEENRAWGPNHEGHHPNGEWQTSYGSERWSCKSWGGHAPVDALIHAAQLALIETEATP